MTVISHLPVNSIKFRPQPSMVAGDFDNLYHLAPGDFIAWFNSTQRYPVYPPYQRKYCNPKLITLSIGHPELTTLFEHSSTWPTVMKMTIIKVTTHSGARAV
jgi:hypothetical protein